MRASIRSVRPAALVAACLLAATSIAPAVAAAAPAPAQGSRSSSSIAAQPTQASPMDLAAAPRAASAAPADAGQWGGVLNWGFQGKHMVALPTGKVLVWSTGDNARVWDPATGAFTPVPATFGDLHCAGQSTLADGRVIVVGGQNGAPHNGTSVTALFDPWSQTWTQGASMKYLRWYATSTTLPDGKVLATSGDAPGGTRAPNPEVYDPVANSWTVLTGAPRTQGLYPLMFVLPNGKVFESGPGAATASLTTSGTGSWATGPANSYSTSGYSESAVMLRPGVVLRAGGGDPALTHVSLVDMNAASPTWRAVAPLNFPRRRMNLTILADGTAIALGGTRAGDDETQAVLDSEIWDPATETWTTVAPMAEARMYHSSAVLLDDGRVLVAGGEAAGRLRAQIYSPAYLFKGARPVIASAPTSIGFGTSFSVDSADAGSIGSVALIRDAAATHAFDQNQRYVPLTFSAGTGVLSVTAPPNGGVAPPGYYLLVIKNSAGVPSVAKHVRLDTSANTQPATITGTVTDAATAQPVAGATVTLPGVPSTTTATNGTYTLGNLSAGQHQVEFGKTGFATVTRSVTLAGGQTLTVDVALSAPGSISGVVRENAAGNPVIAGATVTYPGGSTTTDANGAYLITGLPAGSQPISAAAIGFVSGTASPTVVPNTTVNQDFLLDRSATYVAGEVRDALTNATIAGATVEIGVKTTLTDAQGRYRIDVPPGTYDVTASAPGYPPFTASVVVSPGAYGTLDFSLLRTGATKVFNATADAYVRSDGATKNYGNDPALRVRSPNYASYLKFSLTGLLGRPVTAAQVRVFTTDPSPDGGHVFLAGNDWTELAINWNNAPATSGSQVGAFGAVSAGTWGVIDLPPALVPGEGTYTFKVVGQSTNSAYYSSRQGASPPELDVTLGSAPAGAPVAGITASPASGTAPLTVTFSDASTGGPTSWAWDFGDGTTSTAQFPPAHTYTTAGTYTVSLVASNSSGPSAPATKTISVTPAPPPPPPGSNPIKTMTFEGASLTDPVTGADSVTGALTRETVSPILGTGSVRVPNLAAGYLQEGFTAVPDLFVAFDLRLTAIPSTASRILLVSDQGTTVGNLQLLPTGQLRLRNASATIGMDSTALIVGTVYRVAIHQRQGTGSNAVVEAFLAPAATAFGSPFATLTTGSWTTLADRIRFGATAGGALDATADNIALDAGSMPAPAIAVSGVATFVVASTYRAPALAGATGVPFNCMIPFGADPGPQAQVTAVRLGLGDVQSRGKAAV
jgi:hypothetical protein